MYFPDHDSLKLHCLIPKEQTCFVRIRFQCLPTNESKSHKHACHFSNFPLKSTVLGQSPPTSESQLVFEHNAADLPLCGGFNIFPSVTFQATTRMHCPASETASGHSTRSHVAFRTPRTAIVNFGTWNVYIVPVSLRSVCSKNSTPATGSPPAPPSTMEIRSRREGA